MLVVNVPFLFCAVNDGLEIIRELSNLLVGNGAVAMSNLVAALVGCLSGAALIYIAYLQWRYCKKALENA